MTCAAAARAAQDVSFSIDKSKEFHAISTSLSRCICTFEMAVSLYWQPLP
jgi:hypothetical protein